MFFDGNRKDGTRVRNLDPFRALIPFLMRGRNESVIFHSMDIDLSPIREFRSHKRKTPNGVRITLFHIILAAWVRTIAFRPQFNRFILGQRVYQRNRIQLGFVFKTALGDEESRERTAKIDFSPFDTLDEVAEKVAREIARGRNIETSSDALANFFGVAPRFALNTAIRIFRFLDYFNIAPWFVIKDDPLYSSMFIANLGSIGMNAPYHHLFEWGNTSMFVVIGEPERKIVPKGADEFEVRTVVPITTSFDDRISEGIYSAKGVKLFRRFCEHPEELLERPDIPQKVLEEHALRE